MSLNPIPQNEGTFFTAYDGSRNCQKCCKSQSFAYQYRDGSNRGTVVLCDSCYTDERTKNGIELLPKDEQEVRA